MRYLIVTLFFSSLLHHGYAQKLIPFSVGMLWGYQDLQGNTKIEPQYQYVARFTSNMAVVMKEGKLGVIDTANHIIIPFKYEYLKSLDSAEFIFGYRAKYFGEYTVGVIRKDELVKIPAMYNNIYKYRDRYHIAINKDSIIGKSEIGDVRSVKTNRGLLDSSGQVIIPCKYNGVEWFTDSLLVVDSAFAVEGGKYYSTHSAFFTLQGKQLTGFDYLSVGKIKEGLAKVRIGNRYGFVDGGGKVVIPVTLEYSEEFINGYALFKQQDKWGAIDKTGKIVLEAIYAYEDAKKIVEERYTH